MRTTTSRSLKLLAAAAVTFVLFGCMTQPKDRSLADGSIGILNQEAVSMGQVITAPTLAKSTPETDSITHEVQVTRDTTTCTDSAGHSAVCFVRDALFTSTNANGVVFTRERKDTVWLDSSGIFLTSWNPLHATTLIHHRHISRIKGDRDVEIQFNTILTWSDSNGVRMGIWSGTITGTLNGVEFKNATISGVKRPFDNVKGFGPPTDGDIKCQRGNAMVDMHFHGAGKAGVDISDGDGKHHVDVDGDTEIQKN